MHIFFKYFRRNKIKNIKYIKIVSVFVGNYKFQNIYTLNLEINFVRYILASFEKYEKHISCYNCRRQFHEFLINVLKRVTRLLTIDHPSNCN